LYDDANYSWFCLLPGCAVCSTTKSTVILTEKMSVHIWGVAVL